MPHGINGFRPLVFYAKFGADLALSFCLSGILSVISAHDNLRKGYPISSSNIIVELKLRLEMGNVGQLLPVTA